MRVKEVTFAITRTLPLQPMTGREADAYANIKPMSAITVELADGDDVDKAKALARDHAFKEITQFTNDIRKLLKGP